MNIDMCIDGGNKMKVSLAYNLLGYNKVTMYIWDLKGVLIDHKVLNLNENNETDFIGLDHVEKEKNHLVFISYKHGHHSQLIKLT